MSDTNTATDSKPESQPAKPLSTHERTVLEALRRLIFRDRRDSPRPE